MTKLAFIAATVLVLGNPHAGVARAQAQPAAAQAAVTVPDTAAGRGLQGFIASFNEGGDKRQAWLKDQTTMGAEGAANIFQQDVEVLEQHGPMSIVRLPAASQTPTTIVAIVRHAKSGVHGHLTIEVEADAPHKVSNMGLRGATPEEVEGK